PEGLQLREAAWSSGTSVAAGQVLAVMDADREVALGGEREAEAGALRIRGSAAQRSGNDGAAVAARAGAVAAEAGARLMGQRVARSELRAPFAGRVLSSTLLGRAGARYEAGDTLCLVGDFAAVRATAHLWEFDLEDVQVGADVRVRLRAEPGRLLLVNEAAEAAGSGADRDDICRKFLATAARGVAARRAALFLIEDGVSLGATYGLSDEEQEVLAGSVADAEVCEQASGGRAP